MTNLLARIYAIDPDVILIDLENPSRDVLEQMFQVGRIVKRPIAMFVDQSDVHPGVGTWPWLMPSSEVRLSMAL